MIRLVLFAFRRWRGQRTVLAGIALSVGLGFGANLIVVDSIGRLIRESPVPSQDGARLVRLGVSRPGPTAQPRTSVSLSYPTFSVIQAESLVLQGSLAYLTKSLDVEVSGVIRRVRAALVTDGYFSVLGLRPYLGQVHGPDWSANGVAVSYRFWRDSLQGSRQVLGMQLRSADRGFTVSAILPRNFAGVDFERVDLWMPLAAWASTLPSHWQTNESSSFLRVVARLSPDVTVQQAEARLSAVLESRRASGESPIGGTTRVTVKRLSRAVGPAQQRLDAIGLVLMAVSVLLLAAAGANAAAILVSRVLRSQRDFALRLALGAHPRDLLVLVVLDALPIVGVGMVAGIVAALVASTQIRTSALPTLAWGDVGVSRGLLMASGILAAVCLGGLVLLPWFQARRTSLTSILNAGAFGSTTRDSRTRSVLVAVQTGVAALLILGSLLFVRTYGRLRGDRLGFDAEHVAVVDFGNIADSLQPLVARERLKDIATRLRVTPGVVDAGVASGIPLRESAATAISLQGRAIEPLSTGGPYVDAVDGRALVALDARVVRGRLLDASDVAGAEPVVVVNETMAHTVWGDREPLRSCLVFQGEPVCRVVVGIIHDVQRDNVLEGRTLQTFIPLDQAPDWLRPRAVFVRAASPAGLRSALRELVSASGLAGASYRFDTLLGILEPELRTWRIAGLVLGIYGLVSLVVAAGGIFATVSFSLALRKREIAIRRAIGAPFRAIVSTIGGPLYGASAIGASVAVAVVVAVWGTSNELFFGTEGIDVVWASVVSIAAVCAVVSAGVLWGSFSAWKADALGALRES